MSYKVDYEEKSISIQIFEEVCEMFTKYEKQFNFFLSEEAQNIYSSSSLNAKLFVLNEVIIDLKKILFD